MNIFHAITLYSLFVLGPTLLFAKDASAIRRSYLQQMGSEQSAFTWTMEQGEFVTLKTIEPLETTTIRCKASGEVLQWHLQRGNSTSITAIRKGETIHIKGTVNGDMVEKQLLIDDKPWYQFLSFSLQPFLKNESFQKTQFWILAPRRLEMHMMAALKEEEVPVTLHGKEIPAIKVRVAPDGLVGKLFYGHYWYRKPDFLWIKYQGDHGPLSPETVIHLQQEHL